MLMDWDTAVRYLPLLLPGAVATIWLTVSTLVCGLLIALPVAWCRNSRIRPLRAFAITFVFVFRGAPLLVLLFLIYYGTPELPLIHDTWLWGFFREPVFCAVLALSLNSAGYLAEIIAGAVRDVPHGEVEAATVSGMSRFAVLRHVVVPNALRICLRAYGNEVTFVVKGTSVASLVTITDLMASANRIYYNTFDPITPLLAAGLIYFLIVMALGRAVGQLERRLNPELRRRPAVMRTMPPDVELAAVEDTTTAR